MIVTSNVLVFYGREFSWLLSGPQNSSYNIVCTRSEWMKRAHTLSCASITGVPIAREFTACRCALVTAGAIANRVGGLSVALSRSSVQARVVLNTVSYSSWDSSPISLESYEIYIILYTAVVIFRVEVLCVIPGPRYVQQQWRAHSS